MATAAGEIITRVALGRIADLRPDARVRRRHKMDVAAFVVSQPRPHKAGLEKDFPDLAEKPVDAPYGPYLDGFSETQHKYGPFAPIRAAHERLKQKD
jgi:thiosulfate dehydrogenase